MRHFVLRSLIGCVLACLAWAGDTEQCALALAHVAAVHDHSDLSLLVLADHEGDATTSWDDPDRGSDWVGTRAEILRLHSQIERARRERGVNSQDAQLLLNRREALRGQRRLLDFSVALPVPKGGISPFHDNRNHFHLIEIPAGGIEVPNGRTLVPSPRLTRSFEISDQITQGQWTLVCGTNPARFRNEGVFRSGEDQVDVHRPIENITFWAALVFANRVSELEGLQSAYDLSHIVFDGVAPGDKATLLRVAAHGQLRRQSGELVFVPGADGYRLPWASEWRYVGRGGPRNPHFHDPYYLSSSEGFSELPGWLPWNSGHMTQRVASLRANELGVFDMAGNVREWVQDYYGAPTDPSPTPAFDGTVVDPGLEGYSWYWDFESERNAARMNYTARGGAWSLTFSAEIGRDDVGFRLVRPPRR